MASEGDDERRQEVRGPRPAPSEYNSRNNHWGLRVIRSPH
ncbi:hypothetical protein CIRG_07791 [Coccidioides immitis RMSCC 2394]|uniref:Uncharacterized protein n=1 Tax=Coccidioides immitis RMSCC 2394 TaxID=404692 RepID=A0A0J6YKB8_COCIT|nr:hypothetical protein CIRG_07791 [Coccidioides immitis RMSCC 2394]